MSSPPAWRLHRVLALFALLLLPCAVAPWLGFVHWSVDLVACFVVQTMLALVGLGVLIALCRAWRWCALALGLAALASAAVLPAWLSPASTAGVDGPPLRVLALNLLRGNDDVAGALAAVVEYEPDLVFCSEVTPEWLQALAPLRARLPFVIERADPGYFGVAVFSRLPLRDGAVLPLGFAWAPAVRVVVDTPGGPLGVLGVHTPRPGQAQRSRERDLALAAIPAVLTPLPERRLVLGDFNATPWNHGFRALLATTGLHDAGGSNWQPTWPSSLPSWLRVPIDHVLVSDGVAVVTTEVGPVFGSDHLPVFAELRLPPAR